MSTEIHIPHPLRSACLAVKKAIPLLALAACAYGSAWAATYTYNGTNYAQNKINNFTAAPCAAVSQCANFTTGMKQQGSFTTAAPLQTNLANANIAALITSYSFDDGLTQYTSGGANDHLLFAKVSTDSMGNIVNSNIILGKWQTASHGVNDRLDTIAVNNVSNHNVLCDSVTPAGACSLSHNDTSSSDADTFILNAWTIQAGSDVASVPTLSEWGLLLLVGLLGTVGLRQRRKA